MTIEEETQAAIEQTERIGLVDFIIAGSLFGLVWLLLTVWEFPGLAPSVWNDAVVAAGVRPAVNVMPNYWTGLATLLYKFVGIGGGNAILRVIGHVTLAMLAVGVYAILREILAFVMRARPQISSRRAMVMRLAALIGTAVFVCADPVWTAGQCFSETNVMLLLTFGAMEFFFLFLRKGAMRYAYYGLLLLGLLAAETPVGFVLPIVFVVVNLLIMQYIPILESPFFKPTVIEVGKWHMTFIFLVSLAAGVAINCLVFVMHDGLAAIGTTTGSLPLAYIAGYWLRFAHSAGTMAWALWFIVCLMPLIIALLRFPSAADEEQFLSYSNGMVFAGCGALALSQCLSIAPLWFWSHATVNSQLLLILGLFCLVVTLALAITVLGIDSLCRNHARIAENFIGIEDTDEDDDEDSEDMRSVVDARRRQMSDAARRIAMSRSTRLMRMLIIVCVPLLLLAMLLPGRVETTTRQMLEIIDDAIGEIVAEAGNAKYLLTDGKLDAAIELESAHRGGSLKCLSLLSGDDRMSGYLRTRGISDEEDLMSFSRDTAMGLRGWIHDHPERLADCAVQMGFDLWKRDGKGMPPMGGFLSRPAGFANDAVRLAGVSNSVAIARRMLAIYEHGDGIDSCSDSATSGAFLSLQWRLARMCLYRSETLDLAGDAEAAIAEAELAEQLNTRNRTYLNLMKTVEEQNNAMLQKLTPREGLQLSLVRADFIMARAYAETILKVDPENPDANFAMGMFHLSQRQLARAEHYLKRCLLRRPGEPAVYNNLAMVEIELGKFDAAAANVEKALRLVPDSSAVKDTKKALEAARAKAAPGR